jgi:hypothetical protein
VVVVVVLVLDKEVAMALAGLAITLAGFLIAVFSVGISGGTGMRLILVLAGIVVSLVGIIGVINPAYQRNAVWKK